MDISVQKSTLKGRMAIPGSKSHTVRAVILAALAEGDSEIANPLEGQDGLSALRAVERIGAQTERCGGLWKIRGAGAAFSLPDGEIDVGNSGSVLYFLSPIAATRTGLSIFTGDESIRSRPVHHLADALIQAGAHAHTEKTGGTTPPLFIRGPIKASHIYTDGRLSQYISGFMMAASLLTGTTEIELSDPKETPYLTMTKTWLEKLGVQVNMSRDFKHVSVTGPKKWRGFKTLIPSDWEAAAFPLIAALISAGTLCIENIDLSGSQCDGIIVPILKSFGADIRLDKSSGRLTVCGGRRLAVHSCSIKAADFALYAGSEDAAAFLRREDEHTLGINCSAFPDAVCALAVIACFTEGTVILEDIGVCRSKETDRIALMCRELKALGADIEEGRDFLLIRGRSPLNKDGSPNPDFKLHGGTAETGADHRVAMSLACLGLGLPYGEVLTVKQAECCAVSFPGFIEAMKKAGAAFEYVKHA
ncbi:3-phosphoshikimate 1-carboxyvinyltransferase [Treponema sp. OMZ 840]|uniref:3-phosphoshikimate 1-carboxyvinyltransferase n=1 Tax=Treponema sp. OMZ 840 TaxID=244313 RepID=UPI003D8DB5CB